MLTFGDHEVFQGSNQFCSFFIMTPKNQLSRVFNGQLSENQIVVYYEHLRTKKCQILHDNLNQIQSKRFRRISTFKFKESKLGINITRIIG